MSRSGAAYLSPGQVSGSVMASGRYYGLQTEALSTQIPSEARIQVAPFFLPRPVTVDRIAAEVASAGTAGALVRLGIYSDNGSGVPASLLLDAGTIDGTSATVQEITVSIALPAGLVWLGSCVQGGAGTRPTMRALSAHQSPPPFGYSTSAGVPVTHEGYEALGVPGALPSTFTFVASNIVALMPRVLVRVQ